MKRIRPESRVVRPRRSLRRRGAALVIILAFVVLLTVLVVAYFSFAALQRQISQAGVNQAAAAIFAEGAVQMTIGDLRSEIIAGSVSTNVGNGGTITIYHPTTATNAVPTRVGTADTLPNLVKRSAAGLAFYSGGTSRASAISTTTASQNGRYFTPERWNAALLLPKASSNVATNLSPIGDFVSPDWIFVSRDGSNPTTWNNNLRWNAANGSTVVGRYAYAIYDEGGLLDVNVAGYPAESSTNFTKDKGGLAYADLTVLPGMTTNAINALVGWRNYASSQPIGNLPSYTFNSASQTNYFQAVQANRSGFLRTANTNLISGQSDRRFVSRQQLIQFLTHGVAQNDADRAGLQNALQYLATSTRDLEQPSFRPDPNRPKNKAFLIDTDNANDTYGSSASKDPFPGSNQDRINPWLLSVRDANGEPILKKRFPLSRLALLADPSNADAAKVKQYFGLTWDNAQKCWTYDHGDSTRIYQLGEIPAGREPDFFEILKAAIHCDTLGKQLGALEVPPSPHSSTGALIDGQIHLQLVQIAANLIDQYDADSYPTSISFDGRQIYGTENLPYLAGWQQMWYRMKALTLGTDIDSTIGTPPSAAEGTVYESTVMIQPIIWNPHAPDANPTSPNVPTQFRIVASGMTDVAVTLPFRPQVAAAWWTGTSTSMQSGFPATAAYAAANAMTKSGAVYFFPNAVIDPAVSILTFNTGSGDAEFREPFRLRAPDFPAGSNAANDPGYPAGKITIGADPFLVAADGGSPIAIGFNCGKAWTGPSIDKNNTQKWLGVGAVNRDIRFKLQYKKGGDWLTYDVISDVYNASGNVSTVDNADVYPYLRAFRTCLRGDARTNRWGLFHMATFPSNNLNDVPATLDPLPSNGVDGGYGNNAAPHYYLPQGITARPGPGAVYAMGGAALGLATAPGWGASVENPGDLMVNLMRAPNANPNSGTKKNGANPLPPGEKLYYTDADGVARRASGWNFSGTNGLPMYTGNYESRPVILNRPFRSIGEMGYAFRGAAWKDVDFFTPESGDAALLDVFCLNELDATAGAPVVAGRVNLNTRQPKVIQAVLQGVSKAEGGALSDAEAEAVAQALVAWTSDTTSVTAGILNKGPLRNRSELVGKFVSPVPFSPPISGLTGGQTPVLDGSKTYQGFSSMLTPQTGGVFSKVSDASIKRRSEGVVRALADSGNTRTWNLLIDVAAQVGRFPLHATSLNQFTVEGESRYWVHVAVDRNTGDIVAKALEAVSE